MAEFPPPPFFFHPLLHPQIYCRPTYEWADIKLQDLTKGPWSPRNVIARFGVTLTYSCLMTLVSCAIPFL